jgi:ATP-dependent Clp protease adaptor protein ClpS
MVRSLKPVGAWKKGGPCRPGLRYADGDSSAEQRRSVTGVVVKTKPKTRSRPCTSADAERRLHADGFVVHCRRFFSKTREEATRIMLHVHRRGVGICGVFTYEVAETKVTQVMDFARQHQHPLQCTLEKE